MTTILRKYKYILTGLLIILLVPLVMISIYNRPIYDDLCQPQSVHATIQAGNGLVEALNVALQGTFASYHSWNGVFFSMFLSRIPPMVFNYQLTFIHAIFFIVMLIVSVMTFCRTVGRLVSVNRLVSSLLGLLLMILFFTQMPSIAEGIYWYSAAVNYSFMFSLSLLLISGMLRWTFSAIKGWKRWLSLTMLCISFFLLGGGNFTTSTVTVLLYGYWLFYCVITKKHYLSLLPFLFLCAGYALAVLAPGNNVRMTKSTGYSLIEALYYGLRNTLAFSFRNLLFYTMLLLLVPIAYAFSSQANVNFNHPVIAIAASFLLLFAGFLPPIYSLRSNGPDRLLNIQFFLLCLLYAFNMIYLMGYFRTVFRRFAFRAQQPNTDMAQCKFWRRYLMISTLLVIGALLVNAQIMPLRINSTVPSIKALANYVDGSVQRFADEYDAIVQQAQENPEGELTVSSVPVSDLFIGLEIDEDSTDWNSSIFAKYYGCKSIRFTK